MKKLFITGLTILTVGFSQADETKKVIEIGENVSKLLMKNLKSELMKALSKSPYEAIDVCHKKALEITKKVEKEVDHGIKIKRTSLKYRNPKNAPDKYEKQALQFFEKMFKEGKNAKYYVQKLENGYRYYKPLKVKAVCLTCHGDPNLMDRKLLEKIKKYYPQDKAVGYKEGDFRGVIRVYIPQNALK